MHLLQQQKSSTTHRDRSHHRGAANHVGSSDHRNPSTSSEVGTSAVTSHGSHHKVKGHQRQRSDTPGAPGSGGRSSSKSQRAQHCQQRAMSPSTSKTVRVVPTSLSYNVFSTSHVT